MYYKKMHVKKIIDDKDTPKLLILQNKRIISFPGCPARIDVIKREYNIFLIKIIKIYNKSLVPNIDISGNEWIEIYSLLNDY